MPRNMNQPRTFLTLPRAAVVGGMASLALLLTGCSNGDGSGEGRTTVVTTANAPSSGNTAQPPQGPPIEKTPTTKLPEIVFNYLGGNSKVIKVYPGPGNSVAEGRYSGTYFDGERHEVECQDSTDTRTVHSVEPETARESSVWYKLRLPEGQGPQYATAVYADVATPDIPIPPC
jgi:hypothetical protein